MLILKDPVEQTRSNCLRVYQIIFISQIKSALNKLINKADFN